MVHSDLKSRIYDHCEILRHASTFVVAPPREYHLHDRVWCLHFISPVNKLAAVVQHSIVVVHVHRSAAAIAQTHAMAKNRQRE